jgi:hypothetical protein
MMTGRLYRGARMGVNLCIVSEMFERAQGRSKSTLTGASSHGILAALSLAVEYVVVAIRSIAWMIAPHKIVHSLLSAEAEQEHVGHPFTVLRGTA